jgi:phage terminase small subunit
VRGRKALPDSIKALKGNPGKRKLKFLESGFDNSGWAGVGDVPMMPTAKIPNFLTDEKEIEAFRTVIDDYLQRRVARTSDLSAYGRWAHYLMKWIWCKEQLAGKPMFLGADKGYRRNPIFRDMLDIERMLQSLEDRLGLNPIARQNIVRGLAAMPSALAGLYDEEKSQESKQQGDEKEQPTKEEPPNPLGFLSLAGKPH